MSASTMALARRFLGDEDPYVRCQAAILLGTVGDGSPNLLPLLARMLDRNYLEGFPFDAGSSGISGYDLHSDLLLQTVGAVAQAKGSGGDPNIVKALNQLTNSDTEGDPAVRQAARQSLDGMALNELRQHASE
jgi:HEAT repeat protein